MPTNRVHDCTICFSSVDGNKEYLRHIRQVHGNDRLFSTHCPLCDSSFIFTYSKSFLHHFRKHLSHPLADQEEPPLLFSNDDQMKVDNCNEFEHELLSFEIETRDPVEELKKHYTGMLLKLREGHVLPGNVMKTISLSISCLLQTFSDGLLPKLNLDIDNKISGDYNQHIENILFDISRNEHSFISSCQMYFKFVKPIEISLPTGGKAYYVPICEVLLNLFQKNDLYNCIKQEKHYISQFQGQDILYHYRNAEIGRQHPTLKKKDNCLLLQLYSDDLGVVNPLMGRSSTHKLTTFYFSIDDLPARHKSSLNTVHLLLLCTRNDFEDQRNRRILFRKLSEDLKHLENNGLILPGDVNPTYFTISTLCADNLAAHELGGFTCAFNYGYCCRYCLTNHRDMKTRYNETQVLIRTTTSHDLQVKQVRNVPGDKKIYGINEESILSILPSFHPVISLPPDIMHDILEGVMPKLTACLLHTIVSSRLCSAAQLCRRINKYTYGVNDKQNRPPPFKEKDILDERVPGKAMEKFCLFLNLPFILYDIVEKIPYWFLYEELREIWDVLYCDYPRKSWLSTLEETIWEFVQLFQTIYPAQFIPKCHFLIHAARNIAKYGPLKRQMNLRYEAKHHLLKQIANRCNNFINLPYTISRRAQLRQCYELMDNNILKPDGVSGKFCKRRTISFKQTIQNAFHADYRFNYGEFVQCVKWVTLDNVRYKIGDFFVFHLMGGEEIPLFVEIKYIINIEKEWRFIVQLYDTVVFKQNLWCYELSVADIITILSQNDFVTHRAEDCYTINNLKYIRTPYRLTLVE
ncbi:unnamed protein product [Rotaria magnacalcarata]|uniref:C2H2-type domain-containing protein n=1 Tax=Rotaria magnacalcarata TaxID=392030 RepID=A0A816M854_9BILA|nr:unnamed protein product [Rotaria magnacalcarata]